MRQSPVAPRRRSSTRASSAIARAFAAAPAAGRATASRPSATSSTRPTSSTSTTSTPTRPRAARASAAPAAPDLRQPQHLHPQGRAGAGPRLLYDSLLAGSADEPDAVYGLVAESLEYRPTALGHLQHAPRGDLLRRRADHRRGRGLHLRGAAGEGRALLHADRSATSRRRRRSTRTPSSSPSRASSPATCRWSSAGSRSCRSPTTSTRVRRVDARAAGRLRPLRGRRRQAGQVRSPTSAAPTTGARTCRSTSAATTSTATLRVLRRQHAAFEACKSADLASTRSSPPATGRPPTTSRPSRRLGHARRCPTTAPPAPRASGSTCAARSSRTRACARRSG